MSAGVPNLPAPDPSLGCNCQYPIGLVVFLIFTTMSLLVCICICCFDITKFCKRKDDMLLRKSSSFDARLFDSTKFIHDRKISLDPRLLEYTQFMNSSSNSSQQTKSTDLTINPSFSFDSCPYVSTV